MMTKKEQYKNVKKRVENSYAIGLWNSIISTEAADKWVDLRSALQLTQSNSNGSVRAQGTSHLALDGFPA